MNKTVQQFKLIRTIFFGLTLSLFAFSSKAQTITYSFTTAGATGSVGPNQTQINTAYSASNLSMVICPSGIQSWTVPSSGTYLIDCVGASGGNAPSYSKVGGMGARMRGVFTFTAGQVVQVLVGQAGANGCGNGGGGGGSYVVTGGTVVIAAGGGGGCSSDQNGVHATTLTAGTQDIPAISLGGTNGNGGATCNSGSYNGGGGGGYNLGTAGNGQTPTTGGGGGQSFLNGGLGGFGHLNSSVGPQGGFGGGGGGSNCTVGGGGGGGYSGGAGGQHLNQCTTASRSGGGGGGSMNAGSSQTNTPAFNTGAGRVIFTSLCSIRLYASGTNSLNPFICSGTSLSLTTDAISNYSWSTGNTTSSVIVISPTVTTTYSVSGTSTANCNTSANITVSVNATSPNLVVTNTGSNNVCPGAAVTLSASGATTYSWTNNVSNGVAFTASLAGTSTSYTVNGTNACGTTSAVATVSVHTAPTLSITASTASLCSGNSATLVASGANTYTWSGGPVPVTNGVAFFPPSSANYTVIGTSALGCTNSAQSAISVVLTPSAQPTAAPSLICIGACSSLNASGATSYTWLPGNINSSGAAMCPTTTTTYTLIKSNSNCVDTKTVTVIVNQLPSVFALATPSLVCASRPAVISGGGATTFTWQPGNLTGANVTVTPASNTIYTVSASDGTCVNTTTVALNTKPNPTVSIVPSSTAICFGNQATLTANGGDTYTWTPSTLSGTTVLVSPPTSTLFTVVGENSVNCTHTVTQVMVVNPNPTVTTVANRTLVCAGGSSTLTAGGAHAYLWNTGSTSSLNVVSPLATSVYTVTGTYTTTGCNNTRTISVSVYTPSLTITGSFSSCVGGTVNLTASVLAPTGYTWNPGSANPYYFPTIAVSPSVPTVYVVTALSTSNAVTCPVTGTVAVAIYANPTVTAVPDRTLICRNESVNVNGGGASTYTWNTNQVGTSVPVSPTVQTNYTVTGTDANGCIGTATLQIKVSPCTALNEQSAGTAIAIYPNPNNGEFVIEADRAMELNIINELGQLIQTLRVDDVTYKATVSHLASGIYFITGKTGNEGVHTKIIVK